MKDKKNFYESYLKNNTYITNMNKSTLKQKFPKSSTEEFLTSLQKSMEHFTSQRKKTINTLSTERQHTKDADEFNEKSIVNQFPKTDREPELKQQRKIVALYQRIYQLNHDINELKYTNLDLIGEIAIEKKHIRGHKTIKDDLENQKQKWEKRITQLKETIESNKQLIKQLNPIINIALEELDRQAFHQAKQEVKQTPQNTLTQSQSLPAIQFSKQGSRRKLK